MRGWTFTACMAFLVVFLVSCAQQEGSAQPAGDGFELDGTEWVLESLNGEPLLEDTNITPQFDNGRYSGYSGCNFYGGDYTATDSTVEFVSGPTTLIGCDTPILQQEEAYWQALYQAVGYRVTDDCLEFVDSAGNVTLMFTQKPQLPMNPADLVGTKWRLRAVSGDDLPDDALVTLNFPAAGIFSGVLGCIDYSGKYTAEGDDIWFTEHHHDYARCSEGELDGYRS